MWNTIFKTIYRKYWLSGHFTIRQRAKATCKTLLIQMLVVLIIGSVLIGVAYYYLGDSLVHIAGIVVILAGNVYGMCVLVVLLAYGIAFVPITVWKKTNYDARLY